MKLSPQQQLELLAETPTRKWLVTEEGEFEEAGMFRAILEQFKGWLGYGDRTSPVAVEYAFIRLLEKGGESDIFTPQNIGLIKQGAKNAGLITGNELDRTTHAELAKEIDLIRQHVLTKEPLDITSLQSATFDYYSLHEKHLMHILPSPDRPQPKITQATKDILPPAQEQTSQEMVISETPNAVAPVPSLPQPISAKEISVISPPAQNPSLDLWLNDLRNKNLNWNAGDRLPLDNCYRRLCGQARPQSRDADLLDACVEQLLLTAEGFEGREYKKKALLLDRLDEHLGFSNALAVLAAGYQLAHHLKSAGNLFEREESANALALFKDKLVELTKKFPDAYAKANLKKLRFNKNAVPLAYIQELEKVAAAEQKRSLITKVALGTFVALGALAVGTYFRNAAPAPDFQATVYGPINAPYSNITLPQSELIPQLPSRVEDTDFSETTLLNNTSTIPNFSSAENLTADSEPALQPQWENPFLQKTNISESPLSNNTSSIPTFSSAENLTADSEKTLQPRWENPFVKDTDFSETTRSNNISTIPNSANTSITDKPLQTKENTPSTTSSNVNTNTAHAVPDEKISMISTLALPLIIAGGIAVVGLIRRYLLPKSSEKKSVDFQELLPTQPNSSSASPLAPISDTAHSSTSSSSINLQEAQVDTLQQMRNSVNNQPALALAAAHTTASSSTTSLQDIGNATLKPQTSSVATRVLTAEQVRPFLIEQGILPSPEKAKETFWALGDDWWKQVIPGILHKHGKMVFDEGFSQVNDVKKISKEPGYLAGAERISKYFTDRFDQQFSPEFYQQLHQQLKIPVTSELRNGPLQMIVDDWLTLENCLDDINAFSDLHRETSFLGSPASVRSPSSTPIVLSLRVAQLNNPVSIEDSAAIKAHKEKLDRLFPNQAIKEKTISDILSFLDAEKTKVLESMIQKKQKYIQEGTRETNNLVQRLSLNSSFIKKFDNLSGGSLAGGISMDYSSTDRKDITEKLIEEFNQDLTALQNTTAGNIQDLGEINSDQRNKIKKDYQENVMKLIARLYAGLKWVHPWMDGQKRTDLVLLNGLLCREGLHPCILDNPQFSVINTDDDWINYLKDGLTKYEQLLTA